MDIKKTIENLEKNNMQVYFADSKDDVIPMLKKLIGENDTVAVGGSLTLNELSVIDFLRENYNFLDRFNPELSRDEVIEVFQKSFFADTFLMSANAITENGELYNVDGNANRVAAMLYGPKNVIVAVGYNKIVKNRENFLNSPFILLFRICKKFH